MDEESISDVEVAAYNDSRGSDGSSVSVSMYEAMVRLRDMEVLNFHLGWSFAMDQAGEESCGCM